MPFHEAMLISIVLGASDPILHEVALTHAGIVRARDFLGHPFRGNLTHSAIQVTTQVYSVFM
ncbi:hypothetical protein M378DRAFT_158939 [Amanita muscaria Koide BX008]|uniref:Uncharacterized protein n=1 Tax=Amanita muscaria (strain Koide BX008) TaxID=946122 RepID=A0A0C2XE69_AMAMK|nr:hypothetical protein M378DRAFT_158939 [Amanita muscaria Koide BX008]